jgi:hypothetical protein
VIIKYHWLFRLLFSIIAVFFLISLSIRISEPSLVFTAILFLATGSLLTFPGKAYRIFQIGFFWLIIFACIQMFFFLQEYNQVFDHGGDDTYFFETWILPGYYDFADVMVDNNPYKMFTVPASLYLRFINFIGLGSVHSFHINIINVFLGAFIPVFVYKLATFFASQRVAQWAAAFVIFYPFFNYQVVKVMRDVHIYMLFTVTVYLISSRIHLYTKIIYIAIILFLVVNVRKEALLYFLVLFGTYAFIIHKGIVIRGVIILGIVIASLGVYYYMTTVVGLTLADINRFSQLYEELRQNTDSGNSIATILKNAGFMGKLISVPYIWLSPLPPPALFSLNIMTIMISLGCLFWYYLVPRGVLELHRVAGHGNERQSALARSLIVTFLLGSLFISYTSGDPRHLLIFFPISVIFCFGYFENKMIKRELDLNYLTILIGLSAVTFYIYIKFLR